tara:strand:+ start:640 stop:2430 length:1791 start_codon:yes stop_codon:yes gene_type:complete
LSPRRRNSFLTILPIALITGLADVAVVGIVSRLFTLVIGKPNKPSFPFQELVPTDTGEKVIWIVIIYIICNWLASFLRLILRARQEGIRASIFLELSQIAQKKILYQEYEYFLTDKSNDLSSKILLNITRVSEKMIRPILQIVSGLFISTFIFVAILSFAKITAFILIIFLVIGYLMISLFVTPFIRRASKQRIILESKISKVLSESVATITDVHLSGSEGYFTEKFNHAGKVAFPYLWKAETFPEFPRALVEPFGVTLIFCIGLFPLISDKNPKSFLELVPFLATIAVASLKLTPPLQDLFRGITDLRSGIPDVEEALKVLELENLRKHFSNDKFKNKAKIIIAKKSISLKNINYSYPSSKNLALNKVNINIPIGSKIAFVGKTGSGKTTAANILLNLIKPNTGKYLIDGQVFNMDKLATWQRSCSYVPQTINLLNNTILSNIAFAVDDLEIDEERVWQSIKSAQLENLVKSLPKGLMTVVGENGIRLSGGQRQRIALARAFYRKTKLLILDEATSALDNKTEADVISELDFMRLKNKFTLVIIAHRLSTVKKCECIYEFEDGSIKNFGSYDYLLNNSQSFREMTNPKNKDFKLI